MNLEKLSVQVVTMIITGLAIVGMFISVVMFVGTCKSGEVQYPPREEFPRVYHTIRWKDTICYKCHKHIPRPKDGYIIKEDE